MKSTKTLILLLLGMLIAFPPAAMAKRKVRDRNRIVWTARPSKQTGLFTSKNYFVSHGVSINASAMYYFGDVDNEGVAFSGGFNKENMSYGGSLQFAYLLPAGNHCNMRFGLMGGTLNGNNKAKFDLLDPPRDDYRKFKSILIQPSVGVEYYPFSTIGLYLYGGISLSASIITNYEFYYMARHEGTSEKTREAVSGSTVGFLPMVQLGIGYSWALTPAWTLSAEIMLQEGVIDTHYMNLDAWPLAASQNTAGVELGNSFGTYTDRYGKEHIHWNDGWFQVGISVAYRWRTCEHCRILNYRHTK
jgi:hypothetical protein